MPRASKEYVIDTTALAERFSITKVEDRLVVQDGYDLNAASYFGDFRDEEPRLYTKLERMKESALLKGTLSESFHAAVNAVFEKAIPKPVMVETVAEERKEDLRALLQAAREVQLKKGRGEQSINLYAIKFRYPSQMDEFKTEVAAALVDIVGSEYAESLKRQLRASQNIDNDNVGDELTLSGYIIDQVLPLIDADPVRVEEYKTRMRKDVDQEMQYISANIDLTRNISAVGSRPASGLGM